MAAGAGTGTVGSKAEHMAGCSCASVPCAAGVPPASAPPAVATAPPSRRSRLDQRCCMLERASSANWTIASGSSCVSCDEGRSEGPVWARDWRALAPTASRISDHGHAIAAGRGRGLAGRCGRGRSGAVPVQAAGRAAWGEVVARGAADAPSTCDASSRREGRACSPSCVAAAASRAGQGMAGEVGMSVPRTLKWTDWQPAGSGSRERPGRHCGVRSRRITSGGAPAPPPPRRGPRHASHCEAGPCAGGAVGSYARSEPRSERTSGGAAGVRNARSSTRTHSACSARSGGDAVAAATCVCSSSVCRPDASSAPFLGVASAAQCASSK
mmetsp:Transcript_5960/g.16923  ORF Transcript_5960/g.16923 Transcript_5960/m.16923 type:complete len:327 (-) Transcript_5960:481-1461(-)